MQVSVASQRAKLLSDLVQGGQYRSVEEAVDFGLGLLHAYEEKRRELQAMVAESDADPEEYTAEEVNEYLNAFAAELEAEMGLAKT